MGGGDNGGGIALAQWRQIILLVFRSTTKDGGPTILIPAAERPLHPDVRPVYRRLTGRPNRLDLPRR